MSSEKRVLITGIDGFTGQHMARWLEEAGYEVFGTWLRQEVHPRRFRCDLLDRQSITEVVQKVRPHYLVHLAAISFTAEKDAAKIYAVNTVATDTLLAALRESAAPVRKVVLASSATVYGPQGKEVLSEEMCPAPVQHYGCSKLAMERIAATYADDLPIVTVRPFNYTGPGQDERFVIPKIVAAFRRGEREIELGNIHVSREFNDIRYVLECYRRLLESGAENILLNIASGRGVSIRTVLETMERIAGYAIDVKVRADLVRSNEIPSLTGSCDNLRRWIRLPSLPPLEETLRWMYESA